MDFQMQCLRFYSILFYSNDGIEKAKRILAFIHDLYMSFVFILLGSWHPPPPLTPHRQILEPIVARSNFAHACARQWYVV